MTDDPGVPDRRPPWEVDEDAPAGEPFGPGGWAVGPVPYAVDGLVAGGLGLLVAEVGAALGSALGLVGAAATRGSPLLSVGAAAIDLTPKALKDWAVSTFGTADKAVLLTGVAITVIALLAVIGVLSRRHRALARVAFVALGLLAGAAILTRPGAGLGDALPTLVGISLASGGLARMTDATARDGGPTRREALTAAGSAAGIGLVSALRGGSATGTGLSGSSTPLPSGAPPPTAAVGAETGIPGAGPWVVANGDFYRIDTALVPPRVDAESWSLRVVGEVEREVTLTWAQLLAQPMVTDNYITSAQQEDHLSLGTPAALKCLQIVANTRYILAIEYMLAAQAMEFYPGLKRGRGTEAAYAVLRREIAPYNKDRFLSPDIALVAQRMGEAAWAEAIAAVLPANL